MIQPLIPARLKWLALALGGGLFAAGQFVPNPYDLVCAGLGSVSLYLAGLGWRAPQWAVGKPLLPATLVPLALGAHELLGRFVHILPADYQGYATALVGLLALLGGVLTPEPLKVSAETKPVLPNPDGSVTTQLSGECSLAGAGQGCKP
ncbi:hypothetical protein [Myxococcus phage Mx4 ts27htf-1hrm-1]|nr:hypothetical protein [Myxococcus phage Mx4 ts27htf-1hrm-1]